jgi:hypothetical protein
MVDDLGIAALPKQMVKAAQIWLATENQCNYSFEFAISLHLVHSLISHWSHEGGMYGACPLHAASTHSLSPPNLIFLPVRPGP